MPIDHVTLEVPVDKLADCVAFWELLGFTRVPLPDEFAERNAWIYHGGTTIHLSVHDEPVIPPFGHAAVVVDPYEPTVEALRAAGFEARPQTEFWGAARSYLTDPAGHIVEIMAAPPPIAEGLGLE